MAQFIENKIQSISLQNEPEIKIWCCKISSILAILFCAEKYHNFAHGDVMVRNKTIEKHDFLVTFLSELELKTLNKFKSLKKQLEWLSGRFLLKSCLVSIVDSINELQNIVVAYGKEGAPFLPEFPDIKISLSHSGDYAAVAVCTKENVDIGVDIEQVGEKPDKNFLKIAFTQKEIISMDDIVEDILKKWTAKEAFLKYIKKGFNESLHKVEVIGERVFYNQEEAQVTVFSKIIDNNYVLSLVTGEHISL
ncbi:MAG: 4'-phosphopantetheinyl transferase superfamily protein [Desulfobacteraceae bacterium]|nr:4'-phosphopantetheinyl transferase superfamily protein [Desulfobacteraceae bacterium]